MKFKEAFKKFWHLLWEDDSLKGWLFAIIFLFIFIKLIFFPGLNFLTGTTRAMAIVESCSMYHQHNLFYTFDDWWKVHEAKYEKYTINDLDFKEFPFSNGFNKGDVLFFLKAKPEKLKIGDVITFESGDPTPIIHRIINIKQENGKYVFSIIGDNNYEQLKPPIFKVDESQIDGNKVIGKTVFKIAPYVGWAKLIWFELAKKFDNDPNTNFEGLCNQN
ncbi:MAG: signal peptidase I [Nanoarchaeota archaeon]